METKRMAKSFFIVALVAMVLLVAFPIFSELSAQTIGWVPDLRVAQKSFDPTTDRWTVVWEWSLARVNESPSMPVIYLIFNKRGENITPCDGNFGLEVNNWSQSVDFRNCPDNFSGRNGENGNWFFRTGETHGLQVQPVAITETGQRIYGEKSEIIFALCEDLEVKKIPIKLMRNFPNPFNPITTIHYSVFRQSRVELTIYNLLGKQVAELYDGELAIGEYQTSWNAAGSSSGVYLAELRIEPIWNGQEELSLPEMRIRRQVIKMNLIR